MNPPPKRTIIAAMSEDRIIGDGMAMPWNLPHEYRHFLESVRGDTMIMGRKSWEIFGADVETAHNVVLSNGRRIKGVKVVRSLEDALTEAATHGKTIYLAGGASIYRQALAADLVDEMLLSTVHGDYSGNSFFPKFTADDWKLVETTPRAGFTIRRYARNP